MICVKEATVTATADPARAVTVAQLEADAAWEAERNARDLLAAAQRDLLYYKRLTARHRPLIDAFHRVSRSVHDNAAGELTAEGAVKEIAAYVKTARDKELEIERVQGQANYR